MINLGKKIQILVTTVSRQALELHVLKSQVDLETTPSANSIVFSHWKVILETHNNIPVKVVLTLSHIQQFCSRQL